MLWSPARLYGDVSKMVTELNIRMMGGREHMALLPMAVLMLVMGVASPLWIRAIGSAVIRTRIAGASPTLGIAVVSVMQATEVVPQAYRILPELWLTVTGVLIMLIEPSPGMTRKPIGILALVGYRRLVQRLAIGSRRAQLTTALN